MLNIIYILPFGFPYFGQAKCRNIIIWIHIENILFRGGPHYFHNLNQVMETVFSNKEGAFVKNLDNNAASRPDIDANIVICCPKYQLWSSITS